ncbi:MAG: type 1 glutamine amidotransferase [Pikeienuella sp.]
MKIGVLQCGLVHESLVGEFGEYDRVFGDWLSAHDPNLSFQGWVVEHGEMPNSPEDMDGYILSGSKHGAYEDHAWIPPLKDFIRACAAAKIPMIGVCFGHQIIAEALGGKTVKSDKGWGLGRNTYETVALPDWMAEAPKEIAVHAVHQDQVVVTPPDATVVARSTFCENAALIYGDTENPYAITIQPHPEFSDGFLSGLVTARRGTVFEEGLSDTALASTGNDLSRDWAATWFIEFLRKAKT